MSGNNILITVLIVIILLFGGYYVINHSSTLPAAVSTSTPSGNVTVNTNTTGSNPSPVSAPAVSSPAAPGVITDSAAGVSSSAASVTGKVSPNGAQSSYWFEYGSSSSLGSRTTSQNLGSGYTALPAPGFITGLSSNKTYYYRLSAKNSFGTVNGQTYTFTTNSNPAPQGQAPTTRTLAATTLTRASANLNGSINPNGSDSSYWFEWGSGPDLGTATALQGAGAGKSVMSVSVSVTGLNPLTKYYYRLNSQNQYGTVNGSILSFTTPGPASPGSPTVSTNAASNVGTSTAMLNGHLNPNGDGAVYWFEYGTDSVLGHLIGSGTPEHSIDPGTASAAVSADLSSLDPSTRYYYRLVARNSFGTVRGNIDSFKTR